MKNLLMAAVFVVSTTPACAKACTTTLGYGVVGIKLASLLRLVKYRGWESDAYDVLQRRTGRKLISIYLGSNWDLSQRAGKYTPVTLGILDGKEQITHKQGQYSGTLFLNLPGPSADRELVYDFDNLSENQYKLAIALIHSTCLTL